MRVLLFAPNGGASLSYGGGTLVVLQHARQLASQGHEVFVAGFHALGRNDLASLHGVSLPDAVTLLDGAAGPAVGLARHLPWKLSAYNLLLSGRFRRWLTTSIAHVDPQVVWFHDDIPSAAVATLAGRRVFLYVHYPLLARRAVYAPPLARSRSLSEWANDELLFRWRPVVEDPTPLCEEIWVNSTVTQTAVRRLWHCETAVAPPSARAPDPAPAKERLILSVGTFSLGKNLEPLLEAFARARPTGWTLKLIGYSRDPAYLAKLDRRVHELNRRGLRAEIGVDLSRAELELAFGQAAILAHPAVFEPFGLSVLEGMGFGGVPLAHAGAFSGAWTDLLDRGRFGPGFVGVQDLADQIEAMTGGDLAAASLTARQRARDFSERSERGLTAGFERLFGRVGA